MTVKKWREREEFEGWKICAIGIAITHRPREFHENFKEALIQKEIPHLRIFRHHVSQAPYSLLRDAQIEMLRSNSLAKSKRWSSDDKDMRVQDEEMKCEEEQESKSNYSRHAFNGGMIPTETR